VIQMGRGRVELPTHGFSAATRCREAMILKGLLQEACGNSPSAPSDRCRIRPIKRARYGQKTKCSRQEWPVV